MSIDDQSLHDDHNDHGRLRPLRRKHLISSSN